MFPTDAQQSEKLEFGLYFGIASKIDELMMLSGLEDCARKGCKA